MKPYQAKNFPKQMGFGPTENMAFVEDNFMLITTNKDPTWLLPLNKYGLSEWLNLKKLNRT